jgi:hypothetical protein
LPNRARVRSGDLASVGYSRSNHDSTRRALDTSPFADLLTPSWP